MNNNGARGGWVSPIYGQAKKVYKEIVKACKDVIVAHNGSDLIITFANDSTIQFLSAERYDSIRGFSFNYLIIDEAAFVRREALQEAILPTLTAIGKKCLIISTPKGRGNWFYEYHLKGTSENPDYVSFEGIAEITLMPIKSLFWNKPSPYLPISTNRSMKLSLWMEVMMYLLT